MQIKQILLWFIMLIGYWANGQVATIMTVHKKDSSVYESAILATDSVTYVFDAAINTGLTYGTMTDIEGNNYRIIQVDNQVWMAENLRVGKFRDGNPISKVNDTSQWRTTTAPARCFFEDDTANHVLFGNLYNWYAVNSSSNICPRGWHVPTDAEWGTLLNFLDSKSSGGDSVNTAGSKMKIPGNVYWDSPNSNASNSSGFSANGGGARFPSGNYGVLRQFGLWWSSTERAADAAWVRQLGNASESAVRASYQKTFGFSVRCVKD
jgi:uncharacterized protein (TIGR02145 family)